MWDELSFYLNSRDEAEYDYNLEIAEYCNRYYNPDIDSE